MAPKKHNNWLKTWIFVCVCDVCLHMTLCVWVCEKGDVPFKKSSWVQPIFIHRVQESCVLYVMYVVEQYDYSCHFRISLLSTLIIIFGGFDSLILLTSDPWNILYVTLVS